MGSHNVSELVAALRKKAGHTLAELSRGDAIVKVIIHVNGGIDANKALNFKGYVGVSCI